MKRLLAFLLFLPLLATASIDLTNVPLGGFAMTDTLLGVTNANWAARGTVQDIAGTATNGWPWTNLTVAHSSAVTNGYPWTNLTVAHAGAVTNGYPWTNIPVSLGALPSGVLTNNWANNAGYVFFSNSVILAQSNANAGLVVSNGANFVQLTNGVIRGSQTLRANGVTSVDAGGTYKTVSAASYSSFSSAGASQFIMSGDAAGNPIFKDASSLLNTTLTASNFSGAGTMTATNGVTVQMLYTNGYTVCTTNKQFYFVNSATNPLFVLPNAANVPGVIYHFSTTNYGANFIITNATGTQTIRNGSDLSYTNNDNGIKVTSFISDGAHWWLASKGKVTLPNASWSCSTNTTFANVTNTVTLDTTENNNGQGIYLDNSAWFTPGVGSRIWVTNAGQYMITFSAVWSKVGGGAANGDIWLRQNGTDVPRTMTLQTIQNATSTNVMTVNFIMPVNGVTYFDLQGASPDGTAQLQAMPAITSPFNRPACPSIIVTVNKVSD